MLDGPETFWIFQYTNGDRTGRLLNESRDTKSNSVIHWLWNSNRRQKPIPGDLVFFLRSGERPSDHPDNQNWRGIVGFGTVADHPVPLKNAKSGEGIPVETLAYFPDDVLSDFLIWHDHRLANASVLFGQQGTNFLIERDVAVGILDQFGAPTGHTQRTDLTQFPVVRSLLANSGSGDGVTREIGEGRFWLEKDSANALQLARAISATSNRRQGELTWTHLFLGIVLRAKSLKNTRKNVASRALYEVVDPNGDLSTIADYWADKGTPITRLKRNDAGPVETMSISVRAALKKAKETTNTGVISMDAVLLGLFDTHPDDSIYNDLFEGDLNSIIDRITTQAAENSRSVELARLGLMSIPATRDDSAFEVTETDVSSNPTQERNNDDTPAYEADVVHIAHTRNDSTEGRKDLLDVEAEAKAFARLIASKNFDPPLAIGVFGPWGSGKTFFMKRIQQEIGKLTDPKHEGPTNQPQQAVSSFHGRIVPIEFNAWHYMESNIWASLVDVIFKDLDSWLREENDDAARGSEIDALFDSLTTAQEERIVAIENLAERIKGLESARTALSDAKNITKDYWSAALDDLKRATFTNDKINAALKTLGLRQLADETQNLQKAILEAKATASDANLLVRSLRVRVASPISLVGLAAAILLGPFLIGGAISFAETMGWFGLNSTFNLDATVTMITGVAASAVTWLGGVTKWAQSGVKALRELQTKFDEIDASRAAPLAELETNVDDAKARIKQSEQVVAEALSALSENTSAGQVAAFIRKRAESDVYSQHLGIIDTIRRDFEQLSILIENSRSKADEEEILKQHTHHVTAQVKAISERYDLEDDAFAPVKAALDKLEETNKTGIKLGTTFDRIVLYIDDLDRCPPNKVYEVLQAVHLFLTFPLFVVVVGVDTRWMETSLKEELGKLVDGSSGVNPNDYLEKIFQIPYWTRRMEGKIAREFVSGILPEPAPTPEDSETDEVDEIETSEDEIAETPQLEAADTIAAESIADPLEKHRASQDNGDEMDVSDADDDGDSEKAGDLNTDGGGARILARPVELTPEERNLLAEFAPFAGRSPRKLVRFVNVFGLIKSIDPTDGFPLVNHDNDPLACRALIAQLALATGAPEAAVHHFTHIENTEDHTAYFRTTKDGNLVILANFPDGVEGQIVEPLSLAGGPDATRKVAHAELYEKLKLTAPVARRYTFASADAALKQKANPSGRHSDHRGET